MNIALIGYGKMGKMIEQIARAQGHTIAAIFDPFAVNLPSGFYAKKTIAEANLDSIDAAIEFSLPTTAAANIIALAEKKIPTVTGTTGWHDQMDGVSKAVKDAGSSLLWATNFSIGVNLFYRIAWHAAELANNFPEYDIGGFEAHHNKKLDSPSGTAKTLAEGVLSRIERKKKLVYETMNRKPASDEIHFPSLRMGSVPGIHSLFFDSSADTIEITHTARSREGFASGAVLAAKWLAEKERRGIFTMDEMLKDILGI
jgi:4-hydroxy-tetrahydrodipicolinate reductase